MSETFGSYQLIRKVAQGGMAEVFLASRQGQIGGFSKRVAIKRIYQHLAEDPQLITMFFDEARIAAQFNHPNIVQIYDLGEIDGYFYIAMEYVHGKDLRSICERGLQVHQFLPLDLAVKVVAESAGGLHYAHSQRGQDGSPLNVVHRDVSPQNILLDMNGNIKVCDFGIARAEARLSETRTGQFKGKFAYMSPEQVIGDGKQFDRRSDIFSLGIILYEITVCTRLFRGKNDYDTIRLVAESDVPPPSSVRQGFPPELEAIILKALQKNPDDRYQTARQMQGDLEDWLVDQRAKASPHNIAAYLESIFPELNDRPTGNDKTTERDVSEIAKELGEFRVPKTTVSPNPSSSPAQHAELFGESTQQMMEPVKDSFDMDSELDRTGAIDADRFRQELAQDQQVSVHGTAAPAASALPPSSVEPVSMSNPFGHGEDASSPFKNVSGLLPLAEQAPWFSQPASSQVPAAPDKNFDNDTMDTIPPEMGHMVAAALNNSLHGAQSPASKDATITEFDYDEISGSQPRRPNVADTVPPQQAALQGVAHQAQHAANVQPRRTNVNQHSTGHHPHNISHHGSSQAPQETAQASGWDPNDVGLSVSDDIAALKGGARKKQFLTLGIVIAVVALLVILVVKFAPEREDPTLDDPLANVDKSKIEGTPPTPVSRRSVAIATEPPGASVVINGVLAKGKTPGDFKFPEGRNDVMLFLEGHKPIRAAFKGNLPETLTFEKTPKIEPENFATITVESEPIGAILYHNGVQVGPTPTTLEGLDPDADHHLWLESKEFYPHAALVRPMTGRADKLRLVLDSKSRKSTAFKAQLSLETIPRGAFVNVEGKPVGVTPTLYRHPREEKIEVSFGAPNYDEKKYIIETRTFGSLLLKPRLKSTVREKGKISLSVPKGTQQLFIGNNAYGSKSLSGKEFKEGEYDVVIEVGSGKRLEAKLEVVPKTHSKYKAQVVNGKLRIRKR